MVWLEIHAGKNSLFTVSTPAGYISIDEFHALNGCCGGGSALIAALIALQRSALIDLCTIEMSN